MFSTYNLKYDDNGNVKYTLTGLKEGDYVIGKYKMSTLDTLIMFTDLGNYLFLPVHEIPEVKWKDMGKHVSNIVTMSADEKIIGAMPVYDFTEDRYITVFTKFGMVKRTKLSDFKVGRYTKEIGMIKLGDGDSVVSVDYSNNNDVLVATRNGYGLWYDISEVSIVGIRAAGVKSIKLKDDEVASACLFDPSCEYITILTDKGTAKRMKLSLIEKTSRANRGVLLMKIIKSNPSKIVKCYLINSREEITVKSINEEKKIKLTEVSIMDKQSNGSFIVKDRLVSSYLNVSLIDNNSDNSNTNDIVKEEVDNETKKVISNNNRELKTLKAIDNKIMTIDEILDDIEK